MNNLPKNKHQQGWKNDTFLHRFLARQNNPNSNAESQTLKAVNSINKIGKKMAKKRQKMEGVQDCPPPKYLPQQMSSSTKETSDYLTSSQLLSSFTAATSPSPISDLPPSDHQGSSISLSSHSPLHTSDDSTSKSTSKNTSKGRRIKRQSKGGEGIVEASRSVTREIEMLRR
jgi:hypothetical protein